MGSNKMKTVDMSESISDAPIENPESQVQAKPRRVKTRSKSYTHKRSQVDKTIDYPIDKALDLVKKLSKKAHPTLTIDINYREPNFSTEISFPHSTGKTTKVAILDDKVLAQIEAGQIDFDILLAKPEMMAKVARFAKVLGPRGLMPNPKNKTVTPDPEKRKKELEAGKVAVRSEKKSPLIHVQFGTTAMDNQALIENLKLLIKYLNTSSILKLTISSTMSPGVKIDTSSLLAD